MKTLTLLLLLITIASSRALAMPADELPAYRCTYFPSPKVKEKIDVTFLGKKFELLLIRMLGSEPDQYFARTETKNETHLYSQFGIRSSSSEPLQLGIKKNSNVAVTYLKGRTAIRWTNEGHEFDIECAH